MRPPPGLPEVIFQEISPYLSEAGEEIIDFISSASGPIGKLGEVWVILSTKTVLFFTKEYGKEPVVALIARDDLRLIQYEQQPTRTTLRFVPLSHPNNATTVAFSQAQKQQVNKFCEELSKTTPFELVAPEKKSNQPPRPVTGQSDAVRLNPDLERTLLGKNDSQAPKSGQSHPQDQGLQGVKSKPSSPFDSSVRLVKIPSSEQLLNAANEKPAGIDVRIVSSRFTVLKFAALATFASLVVAFLWYSLFRSLSD